MKILLLLLAIFCVLVAVGALLLPLPPPPKDDAATFQAIMDAVGALGITPDNGEPTNDPVVIHRPDLEILTRQAQSPESAWRAAWFYSRTTSIFAFISGISLVVLSRKIGR